MMNISRLLLTSSIAQGLDIIGDRWSLLILREVFYGHTRFDELIAHTGASRATLSRRLVDLIEHNILYKRPVRQGSNRLQYCLTAQGIALSGPSLLAQQWDYERRPSSKPKLFHSDCGQALNPKAVCRQCRQALRYDDVTWAVDQPELDRQLDEIRALQQQRRLRESKQLKADANDLIYLIGDRWSLLILIVSLLGTCRYDDYIKQLNIAPGVLAARLKTMVSGEIMHRRPYQDHPLRYEYKLSPKGKSIYPFIMSLRQWSLEQVSGDSDASTLIHQPCGHPLAVDVVCGHCHQVPAAASIRLELD